MVDWIRPEERAPTERDVDAQGCVLVWHKYNGCMLMNWHLAWNNPYVLAWMHTPEKPKWLKDEKKV